MSVTTASVSGPGQDGPSSEPRSRLRELIHFYSSPGDRTPTGAGVVIGLLAAAGLVVLGPTSQFWLLACASLLVYAVVGVVRPLEAWRILRGAAELPVPPRAEATERPERGDDESGGEDEDGWLPPRHPRRR